MTLNHDRLDQILSFVQANLSFEDMKQFCRQKPP